jgi:hypothetical protein
MPNSTADKILAECAADWPNNNKDCNTFVKVVVRPFFEPDLFSGAGMNADAIIGEMNAQSGWTKLGTSHTGAISAAKAGEFVIAGMTSTELGDGHGHLAVVVGDDGGNSGEVLVPICYAGSLSSNARVARERVSGTFGTDNARQSRISYFSRSVDTEPSAKALDLLVDFLRRSEMPTSLGLVIKKQKKKKKKNAKRTRNSNRNRLTAAKHK